MGTTFLPTTDGGLLAWAQSFSAQVTADAAGLGVPVATAASLATLVTAYASAYSAANNDSTRTRGAVAAKNTARSQLRIAASDVARLIYGTPTVSDQQLLDLGLSVYDRNPSPVPPPAMAPTLLVLSVIDNRVRYQLGDAAFPNTRRRPLNAKGATILSYVGTTPPPAGDPGWKLEGQTGRNSFTIEFPNTTTPGTPCWAIALWYNARGEFSPACNPVQAYLQIANTGT